MLKPLPREFYQPSARVVAPRLLGHWLIRQTPAGPCGGPIIETEAYLRDDPACHAFGGPSNRNRTMFGHPGNAYVYLIYGFYHCFNTVCQPHGCGEAVLVRAIEPAFGLDWIKTQRPTLRETDLTSGPGKLCAALKIDRSLDGADLCSADSPIFVAENPNVTRTRRQLGPRITTTRIGLTKAANWPLRFYLGGSKFVSKRLRLAPAPRAL